MRDIASIFAAGTILTAYALLAPTMVEAVPGPAPAGKSFVQRLPQARAEAKVSAVSTLAVIRSPETAPSRPLFARLDARR